MRRKGEQAHAVAACYLSPMDSPEQFFESLRLYKRHVALAVASGVILVLGMLMGSLNDSKVMLALALVLSGACQIAAGRVGLRCGRTVLRGWAFFADISQGESVSVGERGAYGYSTRELEGLSPHERLAFARRGGYAMIAAGGLEIAAGLVLAVAPFL